MRKYGHISQQKVHRKIHYLRRMRKPNEEGGATVLTWRLFWKVFFSLRLADSSHFRWNSHYNHH